jgi:hypothetical protein
MTSTTTGWMVFVAAIGMMFGLLAVDIAAIKDWNQILTPVFIGTTMGHIAAVIAAFIGGKIIPEDRNPDSKGRSTDPKP